MIGIMPVPLDEYPVHQLPASMRHVGTSDRNAYDRCYVNAHDRTGDLFVVTGLGVYPNLGVIDAFLTVKIGGRQSTLRLSGELGDDRLQQRVGPYSIEVVEPLRQIRVVCEDDGHGVSADLLWTGSVPAVEEPRHQLRQGGRLIVDSCRFAQVGTCSGAVRVDGEERRFEDAGSAGTRDRSWGVRPVGEREPAGRAAGGGLEGFGFWWTYAPVRFEEFAVVLIAQEDGDGTRTLNEAVRIWPEESGRPPEPLGWPEIEVRYASGTRRVVGATIALQRRRDPLLLEVETLGHVVMSAGPGYNGDPDWTHGTWRGAAAAERVDFDLADPAVEGRAAFGIVDHVARVTCAGDEGWGLFEHASIGRHAPSGFDGFESVAP
jgi:hypothetical protein